MGDGTYGGSSPEWSGPQSLNLAVIQPFTCLNAPERHPGERKLEEEEEEEEERTP